MNIDIHFYTTVKTKDDEIPDDLAGHIPFHRRITHNVLD
jgi:hypothetical protein